MAKKLQDTMTPEQIAEHYYSKLSPKIILPSEAKEFKEWIVEQKNVGYNFDYFMYGRLFLIQKLKLQKKNDYLIIVIGREGIGKSTLCSQLCAAIDHNFSLDKICVEPREVIHSFRICQPGSAIQVDEGALALFSREAMTLGSRNMVKILMTIRAKSFFIVIACPSYKDLDRYLREHRVAMLIDIRQRGEYIAFFDDAIRIINENLPNKKRISAITVPNGTFWQGSFRKDFPKTIDYSQYEAKKLIHIDSFLDSIEKDLDEEDSFKMIPAVDLAKQLHILPERMREFIKNKTINAVKVDRSWFIPKKEVDKLLQGGCARHP